MARSKGLLLWSEEATGFPELLADDPELVLAPLGEAGELPQAVLGFLAIWKASAPPSATSAIRGPISSATGSSASSPKTTRSSATSSAPGA